ncbi:MAG: translocation/assembly module TamB domain-containing protein [Bryobacteraceae bacterium]
MKRKLIILFAALVLLLLGGGAALLLTLRSAWFEKKVHARIVAEVEKATGARVELDSFSYAWRPMHAELRNLTLHGSESPAEPPLFRAERIALGLRIVSLWAKKVDLELIEVDRPAIYYNGSNAPKPKLRRQPGSDPLEQFLALAVNRYRITDGAFQYLDRKVPVDIEGRDLDVTMSYDHAGQAYLGDFAAKSLRIGAPLKSPLDFDPKFAFRFDKDAFRFHDARLDTASSKITAEGMWSAGSGITGTYTANVSIAEFVPVFRLPVERRGNAKLEGGFTIRSAQDWTSRGSLHAEGLEYKGVTPIAVVGRYEKTGGKVVLPSLEGRALGGVFQGTAELREWKFYSARGEAKGFPVNRLMELAKQDRGKWAAVVNGPVEVRGPEFEMTARVTLAAAPDTEAGTPLTGEVGVTYRQADGFIGFEQSHIELPATTAHFRGSIDQGVEVGAVSRDLREIAPALRIAAMPATLGRGQARFTGFWYGGFSQPRFKGHLDMDAFTVEGRNFDRLSADVEANGEKVTGTNVTVAMGAIEAGGYGSAGLTSWRLADSSPLSAKLTLKEAAIQALLAEAKLDWPLQGRAEAQVDLGGTYAAPRVLGRATATGVEAAGEKFKSMEADFRVNESRIEVVNGLARKGAGVVEFSGTKEGDDLSAEVRVRNTRLREWDWVASRQSQLDGAVSGKGVLAGRIVRGALQATQVDGNLEVKEMTVNERPIGELAASAKTTGRLVNAEISGRVRDSEVSGVAEWNLSGSTYGLGQLRFPRMTFAALHDLGLFGDPERPLPLRGSFDAEVGFSGPVTRPDQWTGLAKVTRLEVEPNRDVAPNGQRLILRNREALMVHLDGAGANLQSVRLVTEGTDLEATGTVAWRARSPWNLRLRGKLNLPALSTFEPDLVATGVSTLDATIRGSLQQPNVTGRMELNDASIYLRNVPNGLEKLTGAVVFDRTRANIEKLTAQTGGGDLRLSGFVDFGGSQLLYRLQAAADRVRVRYPEAVSTTFNANMSLTGTASRSLLAGEVTVGKMGITPRTDIGSLLAEAGRSSVGSVAPNDFLRNMQIDLKLVTSPDAELQTSLARDIQPEANFRVRGTGVRPVLLGNVAVTQGEIQFFGNQYTIIRGDVSFANPVKNEPVLDMDLETRVRGIVVTINFSGPVNKLGVSYRSDPPLQPAEIVALLAVGRTPGSGITPNLPSQQNQLFTQPGNNSLLGQAITAPFSGSLQRLFGVSRLKIDPDLTGVTNTPQARLTIEQQLSRDITVTYITNLNRTQQQIVRLQWDFSREFSVLAVRDENGIFGVDFFWRKRFK